MLRPNTLAAMTGITLLAASVIGTQNESVQAPIKKVTVYPDQAQVTRVSDLRLTEGEHTILIEDLPGGAIDASFQVSASGVPGITLFELVHSKEEHFEAPMQRVAQLQRELDSLVRNRKQVVMDRLEGLKQLKDFLAALSRGASDDAADQVAKGGINVAHWSAAYDFVSEKSALINDSIRQAKQELEDIESRLELVQKELRKINTVSARTTKAVSVRLHLEQAGQVQLALEYIVPGAMWVPIYDARINDNPDQVDFSYQAGVSQRTGEDWTDVELTLSTAQLSLGPDPGHLSPWFLAEMIPTTAVALSRGTGQITGKLVHRETGDPVVGASVLIVGTTHGAMTDLQGNFQILRVSPGVYTLRISHLEFVTLDVTDVVVLAGSTSEISHQMTPKVTNLDEIITVTGTQDLLDKFQVDSRVSIGQETVKQRPVQTVENILEQVAGVPKIPPHVDSARGGRTKEVPYRVESASVFGSGAYPTVFKVKGTQSAASGGDAVRVTVANWTLTGETRLISRPKNRQGAFRVVTLKNQTEAPLLAGRVAVFAGPHFLGYSEFDQVIAPGEEFELPFGLDNHVTVEREIVAFMKTTKGNRIETGQTIQITINNHGSASRTIQIEESLPVSRDNRIKVTFGRFSPTPVPGGEPASPKWSLTLEPGTEVKILIPYQISYPSSLRVAGL